MTVSILAAFPPPHNPRLLKSYKEVTDRLAVIDDSANGVSAWMS